MKYLIEIVTFAFVVSCGIAQHPRTYDLKFPVTSWKLASTPYQATDQSGKVLFPEATLSDSLPYGFNRAKLAWYNIDPIFQRDGNGTPKHIADDYQQRSNHYVRQIAKQEVFPMKTEISPGLETHILTFDVAFYPEERGPYNYETYATHVSSGIYSDGRLSNPESRWGGVMRTLDDCNLERTNIDTLLFWLLDMTLLPSGVHYTLILVVSRKTLTKTQGSFLKPTCKDPIVT